MRDPVASLAATASSLVGSRTSVTLPDAYAPVPAFERFMTALEDRWYADGRAAGLAHALTGPAVGAGLGATLGRVLGPRTATVLAATLTATGTTLADDARRMRDALFDDDLSAARAIVPTLVGAARAPAALQRAHELNADQLATLTVERIAAATVDGLVAPTVWAALLGARGVLVQRTVDRVDDLVGHHGDRYERFGWAAARLDHGVQWLPTRVAALAAMAVRPAAAGPILTGVRAVPAAAANKATIGAAFGGALGVQLGGDRPVAPAPVVGPAGARPADAGDIEAALELRADIGKAVTIAVGAIDLVRSVRRERRTKRAFTHASARLD